MNLSILPMSQYSMMHGSVLFVCVCFPVFHVYIFLDDYCLRQCLV